MDLHWAPGLKDSEKALWVAQASHISIHRASLFLPPRSLLDPHISPRLSCLGAFAQAFSISCGSKVRVCWLLRRGAEAAYGEAVFRDPGLVLIRCGNTCRHRNEPRTKFFTPSVPESNFLGLGDLWHVQVYSPHVLTVHGYVCVCHFLKLDTWVTTAESSMTEHILSSSPTYQQTIPQMFWQMFPLMTSAMKRCLEGTLWDEVGQSTCRSCPIFLPAPLPPPRLAFFALKMARRPEGCIFTEGMCCLRLNTS